MLIRQECSKTITNQKVRYYSTTIGDSSITEEMIYNKIRSPYGTVLEDQIKSNMISNKNLGSFKASFLFKELLTIAEVFLTINTNGENVLYSHT